jgi:hypothetical protein
MVKKIDDLNVLKNLPDIKIWGEDFKEFGEIKLFKGKFVITDDGNFIAKIVPKEKYDKMDIYHNTMLEDLGVEDPDSSAIKKTIIGGGKIELEMVQDYVECRLYGSSKTYGDYDKSDIDLARMEKAIEATFHLGMMPILVVSDFENMTAKV